MEKQTKKIGEEGQGHGLHFSLSEAVEQVGQFPCRFDGLLLCRVRRYDSTCPQFRPDVTSVATPKQQDVGFAGIVSTLKRCMRRFEAQIRWLTMTKKEKAELLDWLFSYSTKEACEAEQFRTYCQIFAAKRVFSDCPAHDPDRLLFFEQGQYFLPIEEEEEARRRAELPIDNGEWFPSVAAPFPGHSGEKATDRQILRTLFLRTKFESDETAAATARGSNR